MKVLVTGANGYLGQGVVKELLEMGCNVVAACHSHTEVVDNRAIIKECNIFEIENPYEYFEKPDILLHMAWRDGFVHYSESHFDDLPKHVHFINKFARSNVKTIASIGSMHEIGFYEGSIDENTSCWPKSFYGIAKNALREAVQVLCNQNKKIFQWYRGFYIVGNTQYGSSIFSKITSAAERGEKEFPFTMGQNQFDFINYKDFCYQIAVAVQQTEVNGIINICTGCPEKLSDRVERFIIDNKYDIKLKYGVFPDRPYDSKAVWGNNNKISMIMNNNKKSNNI